MTDRVYYLRATVIGYLLWLAVFEAVGRYAATLSTSDITLEFDRGIPFSPPLIWAYEVCYLFPFVPLLVVNDWHRFNRVILAVVLANVVACAVYLAFPIALPRPVPGADLSSRIVALEYAADFHPGANKLPSLHVALAWLVWLACLRQGLRRFWAVLILATAVAISVATLFVKQHVVLDVVSGAALAFAAWSVAGRLYPRLAGDAGPRKALARVARWAGLPALAAVAILLAARAGLRGAWP